MQLIETEHDGVYRVSDDQRLDIERRCAKSGTVFILGEVIIIPDTGQLRAKAQNETGASMGYGSGVTINQKLQQIQDANPDANAVRDTGATRWYKDAKTGDLYEKISVKVYPYDHSKKTSTVTFFVKYPKGSATPSTDPNSVFYDPENAQKATATIPYTDPSLGKTSVVLPYESYVPIFSSGKAPGERGSLLGKIGPNTVYPGQVADPQFYDSTGQPILTTGPGSGSVGALFAAISPSQAGDAYDNWYNYMASLQDGNVNLSFGAKSISSDIEIGNGGSATIIGGTNSSLYIWHPKNVVWQTSGTNNSLFFGSSLGASPSASGELKINLLTGLGINPFGGTLIVQHVDNIWAAAVNGEYIICNNDGDTVGSFFGGNALIVGGTGNDSLTGSSTTGTSPITGAFTPVTSILVAGPGIDTLAGGNYAIGSSVTDIFVYNLGVDTITNFRPGNGTGDEIDLSAIPGINGFSDVQALMSQKGANVVIDFGSGHTITLDNVVMADLTAENFLFRPVAAFAMTQPGEADAGKTVQVALAITGVVTVDTAGGSPTLTLSDGAIATYDAAASSSSGHVLVFDYAVGVNDHSANLSVTGINLNGAVIQDANAHSIDFSAMLGQPMGLQINPSPLTVSSVMSSQTGEFDGGQIQLTLTMSEPFVVVGHMNNLELSLSDGAIAVFAGSSGDKLIFDYNIGQNDHTPNLTITSVDTNVFGGTYPVVAVQDANGFPADFSGAMNVNIGVRIGQTLFVAGFGANFQGTEADAGQTVKLAFSMSEAVILAGNLPSLSLSDGATATYDAGASNSPSGLMVFDYTVRNNDQSPDLSITSVNLNGGAVTDANGHFAEFTGALAVNTGVQIGPTPLTATSVSAAPQDSNDDVTITMHFNEDVSVTGNPILQLNSGITDPYPEAGIAFYSAGSGSQTLTFIYVVDPTDRAGDLAIASIDLNSGSIADANGYQADFASALNVGLGVAIGPSPLQVNSIGTNFQELEADAGQTVTINLQMSEGIVLSTSAGVPTLTLNDGAAATYDAAASNLSAGIMVFDYIVGTVDRAEFLAVANVTLNGAIIQDAGGHNADFTEISTFDVQVGSDGQGADLQIGPLGVASVSSSQIGAANSGQVVHLGVNLGDPVWIDTTNGTPTLTLSDGAVATYDSNLSDPDTGALVFDYTVRPDDQTLNLEIANVNLNGATIQDINGSNVDFSDALGVTTNVQAGNSFPVTSMTASSDSNATYLKAGHLVTITVNTSEPVTVIGTPTLQLNDHAVAAYTSGSGTDALIFTYTIQLDDNTSDLQVTGLNLPSGSNIQDQAGNALAGGVAGDLGIQIDATSPSVSSIAASGIGITTGSGDLNAGKAVAFEANMSGAVTVAGGSPTLSLNDGGTASFDAAHSTSSELSFDYTIAAGQNTSDLAVSSLNLNGATIQDEAGNNADLSGALNYNPTGILQIDTHTAVATLPLLQGLTTAEQQVEAMYVAYFGRAGDAAGTYFWMGNLDAGQPVDNVAANFAPQIESEALYPLLASANTDSESARVAFIDSIYQNLFNRGPDAPGLAYWDNELHNDQLTLSGAALSAAFGGFILEVIRGAQNSSAGQDITTIENKVAVASYFTEQLAIHNVSYASNLPATVDAQAHTVVAATNSTAASVTAEKAAIDADVVSDLAAQNAGATSIVGIAGTQAVHA